MRVLKKAKKRTIYHNVLCDHITVDCKVKCLHCDSSGTHDGYKECIKCNGHKWIWGSTSLAGYGFTPYTLISIYY